MNIFNKVTLQSMKKSRTRTIVTIIGVILSAAMITAVATFAVSLQNYMVNGAIQKYGSWHVGFLDVPPSFAEERTIDDKVLNSASIENIGFAKLDGGKNPNKPYIFIAGFNESSFDNLPIKLLSGRLPENSGEILIPQHLDENGGVKFSVGDTVTLNIGSRVQNNGELGKNAETDGKVKLSVKAEHSLADKRFIDREERLGQHDPYIPEEETGKAGETFVPETERSYTVVGICSRPAFEEYSAPGYTLITASDSEATADSLSVFVTLKNPWQVHSYARDTAGNGAYIFNDDVLRFMGLSDDNLFNALLYSIGIILIILIMLGSVFLIYNSFTISLNDRTRQFGILMSVGATEKQLRKSVLFEGLCIGAVGIPIGIIIGIPSIKLVLSIAAKYFGNVLYSNVPLNLSISVPALIAAAMISLVTILISAYIPARKAAGIPVMECIRQTNDVKVEPKAVKTSKISERLFGLEGILALKNFKRNKKRYKSIVLSLTLSVVLFVAASSFGMYLKNAAESTVVGTDYDLCFYSQDIDEEEMFRLYDEFKAVPGVYDSSYQAISSYSCSVKPSDFSDVYLESTDYDRDGEAMDMPMDVHFLEDSVYLSFIEGLGLPAEEYTGQNAKMIAVAKAKRESAEQEGKTELIDMFESRDMNFQIIPETNNAPQAEQGQNINITFVDTIPTDTLPKKPSEVKPYVFMAVAPYQLKERFVTKDTHTEMGLTFLSNSPSQSAAEMENIINNYGILSDYTLYNVYEMFEQNRNIIFIVNLFTYVFILMISLIAVANVFNTISTNIRLRRRELAMLRSVGMSDREINKMMNFECMFYGMRTLIFGVPTAVLISWLIYKFLFVGGAEVSFVFPWVSLVISVLGVFLVIFITMLYAVGRIKKENIIEALRDDMT